VCEACVRVLQCVAVRCSALQCVAMRCSLLTRPCVSGMCQAFMPQSSVSVAACCSVLQRVAACCGMNHTHFSALSPVSVAVRCSVLQ